MPLAAAFVLSGRAAWAAGGLWALAQAAILSALLRPGSQRLCPTVRRAPDQPRVALTFDDGPHPLDTPAILTILRAHRVRATFFVVGERARAWPELVRRAAAAGHQIEAHSDTHPWWFSLAGPRRIRREVRQAAATVESLAGRAPRWFRPPMGHKNLFLREALERDGLRLAGWSMRPFDTFQVGTIGRSAAAIAGTVLREALPGSIILLHEGVRRPAGAPSPTLEALGPIIEGLRSRGLEPVSLEDLRGIPEPLPGPAPLPAPGAARAADEG